MKRNVISLLKFCLLAAFTVFLTVVIFRYMRTPPNHRVPTSLDGLAAALGPRIPNDRNQPESDGRIDQVWERIEVCREFVGFD